MMERVSSAGRIGENTSKTKVVEFQKRFKEW